MEAEKRKALSMYLRDIRDPRRRQGRTYLLASILNVSSDLRESEQVILSTHTRCRHTTYELALLLIIL